MKKSMGISVLMWMWTTVIRSLEVVGMILLIFVLFLAGVIEASHEPEPQEWRGDEDDK